MVKACAYLCRQCLFIDGFGEFGELLHTAYRTRRRKQLESSINQSINQDESVRRTITCCLSLRVNCVMNLCDVLLTLLLLVSVSEVLPVI